MKCLACKKQTKKHTVVPYGLLEFCMECAFERSKEITSMVAASMLHSGANGSVAAGK